MLRDSPLGQLLRLVTRDKILLYPEEKPGFIFQADSPKQIHHEKSESHVEGLARSKTNQPGDDSASSSAEAGFDPSLARSVNDTLIVGWYGADDPSNPMNWSSSKKRIVALQIWFAYPILFAQYFQADHSKKACIPSLCIAEHQFSFQRSRESQFHV